MEASLLGLTKSIHCSFDSFVFVMFCRGFPVRAHSGQSNFSFFQQKRKQEILLILIIFTYFTVQTKIEKKMVRKIVYFIIFLILKSASKIQKNTVNG